MLQHPAAAIEKLTIHHASSAAAGAQAAPETAVDPEHASNSFGASLRRCPSLKEIDAAGDCLENVDGVYQISRALASAESNLQRLKMPSVPSMRRDVGVLAEGLSTNTKLEALEGIPSAPARALDTVRRWAKGEFDPDWNKRG